MLKYRKRPIYSGNYSAISVEVKFLEIYLEFFLGDGEKEEISEIVWAIFRNVQGLPT
jgi:hypothetical protein